MILDVGCGSDPKGHINLDLFTGLNPHLIKSRKNPFVDPKKIPNFVKGTAYKLPFPKDFFSIVYCCHVIEHLENPIKAIKELRRVSKKYVIIKVPSLRAVLYGERSTHFFTWSEYSLKHLLDRFFREVIIYSGYMEFRGRILNKLPYMKETITRILQHFISQELTAICRK